MHGVLCAYVSADGQTFIRTQVTLNVVHTSMKSCVVGRVFTGIQMGFYERILETFLFLILLIVSQLKCPIVNQNRLVVLKFPFTYSLGLPERF